MVDIPKRSANKRDGISPPLLIVVMSEKVCDDFKIRLDNVSANPSISDQLTYCGNLMNAVRAGKIKLLCLECL